MSERPPATYPIPEGTQPAKCRGCAAQIFWVKTLKGANMPVDADGTPHWATCPAAPQFKRKPEVRA